LHATLPDIPVMLVTAASSSSVEAHGKTLGASGCMDKVGILDHLSDLLASIGDGEQRKRVA